MLAGTLLVVASWCVLAQGEAIKSQPARGDGTQAPAESSGAIAEFKADAKDYSIRLDARPKEKLVLCDEPLFRWGNPARTGEDGVIFVWLLDGRPEVIGSVFTYRIGNLIRRKHAGGWARSGAQRAHAEFRPRSELGLRWPSPRPRLRGLLSMASARPSRGAQAARRAQPRAGWAC